VLLVIGVEGTGVHGAGWPGTWPPRAWRCWTSTAPTARLAGKSDPLIPASSGQIHRHRLNRGGDRQAHALYRVVLCRMRGDARTRA
jgi:hypothetical protein